MVKSGLLLGVLIVGIVLIIVGVGGPAEPEKVGGVVKKTAQEEYEQSKSTYTWSLIVGIVVCLLSVGAFVLMARSWLNSNGGDEVVATQAAEPAEPEPTQPPPAEPAEPPQEDQEPKQSGPPADPKA